MRGLGPRGGHSFVTSRPAMASIVSSPSALDGCLDISYNAESIEWGTISGFQRACRALDTAAIRQTWRSIDFGAASHGKVTVTFASWSFHRWNPLKGRRKTKNKEWKVNPDEIQMAQMSDSWGNIPRRETSLPDNTWGGWAVERVSGDQTKQRYI